MNFRILGPLEVLDGDVPLALLELVVLRFRSEREKEIEILLLRHRL